MTTKANYEYFQQLTSQAILVTGGSKGIGAEIVRHLHAHGAHVILHYNTSATAAEEMKNQLGDRIHLVKADLNNMDAVEKLYNRITESRQVNCVIHNAGIFLDSPLSAGVENWQADMDRTLAVNLKAPALLTRLFLDHFHDNGGGRFIYIASRAAFKGETENHLIYAASKGGLISLSRSIARSQGKKNIKSFVVAPGFTRTKMAENFIAENGEQSVTSDLAINELTKPQDIAPLISLMATGHMDHATGTCVDINGGSYIH